MLSLDTGVGAWSCLNLVYLTLLTPQGELLIPLRSGWGGEWEQVEEWGKGREGKLGLVCRIKIQSEVTSITVLGKV